MDEAEGKRFSAATFDRARIIKRRSEEPRYKGKAMGVGPATWDGYCLTFDTKPLEEGEEVPEGWFRYGKDYFDNMR